MPRKYSPVWRQAKLDGFCEISAHKSYHKRIRKALRKEKDEDLLYKMECLEAIPPVQATLKVTVKGSIIRFTLHISPLITIDTI